MNIAENISKRSETAFSTLNRVVRLNLDDLHISTRQIARYFGGSGYSFPENEKDNVRERVHETLKTINPAWVYRILPVTKKGGDRLLCFDNGRSLEIPHSEVTPHTRYLAVGVCTLGAAFDEMIHKKSKTNDLYDTLLVDAIGVWFLEDLSNKSISMIRHLAEERGLYAGCSYGPGYGDMPIEKQQDLFDLVNSERIGVSLNEAFMMLPVKSVSFLVNLSEKPVVISKKYKCRHCQLETCQYRVGQEDSSPI